MGEDSGPNEWGHLIGLYKTDEGRVFLRGLSQTLAAKLGGQFNLAAKLVNDPNYRTDLGEVERIRKMLFRKDRKLQAEFTRDPEDNLVLHAKLEHELMLDEDFSPLLADHAAANLRGDAALGIALFFYGRDGINDQWLLDALQCRTEGIYSTIVADFDDSGEQGIGFRDRLHYFHRLPNKPYMLAHEFQLRSGRGEASYIVNRKSGFAFPLRSGHVHRIMTNYENPSERIYDIIFPAANYDLDRFESVKPPGSYFEMSRWVLGRSPVPVLRPHNGVDYHVREKTYLVCPPFQDKPMSELVGPIFSVLEDIIL